jgi:hypothetical protein
MNKIKFTLIFVVVSFFACKKSDEGRVYKIPLLNQIVTAYINSREVLKQSTDIFVVNLSAKRNTLSLEIANTYPDPQKVKFNLDTTIQGHRIIFTGKKIQGYFKKNSNHEFPKDIVEKTEDRRWLLYNDAWPWFFQYNNGKIADYSPQEEIDRFVQTK